MRDYCKHCQKFTWFEKIRGLFTMWCCTECNNCNPEKEDD